MPIYEYRCTACGHKLEALQKFSDGPLVTCPSCGKETLSKLLSAAGFQLKGSGWYQTDFRGGSKPAKTDGDGAKAEGKEGTKSDSSSPAAESTAASSGDKATPAATPSSPAPSPAASSGTGT